jgi:hypothetical protein
MFGVGITPGDFNGTSPLTAISALVETEAAILSHSYGYTAGAIYRKISRFPATLNLLTNIRAKGRTEFFNTGGVRCKSIRSPQYNV